MNKAQSTKYDLEGRTEKFAKEIRLLIRKSIPHSAFNEDCKQLIRSSGSVAANYIEANESLSKKDFAYRIKICLKEAKESRLWINLLLTCVQPEFNDSYKKLANEAQELVRIFSAILRNSSHT